MGRHAVSFSMNTIDNKAIGKTAVYVAGVIQCNPMHQYFSHLPSKLCALDARSREGIMAQ